jgi:CelD/BcsL family acetyltransferase involved in cellulose biosynthesis
MKFIADFPDSAAWDRYVEAHPEARFCHLSAYRCLSKVYCYRPWPMAFLEDNRIVGVLPAFEARSLLFGRRLVSQPFTEYGGMLLDADLSGEQVAEIFEHVREFVRSRGLSCIEMHGRQGVPQDAATSLMLRSNDQQHAELALDLPLEELYESRVTYQARKAVQKARRSNLTVEERSDEESLIAHFFPYYLDSMRRLGSPPHSLRYYLECKRAFGPRMRIFWAMLDGKPIAGLLGFSSGCRVNILNIVSDPAAWELRPNDLIHWEYIQWAHRQGFQRFDFGSIRYEGQLHYKKKWGCTIADHAYYYVRVDHAAGAESAETFDSSSPRMKRMSELWAKHMPRAAARMLGPAIRKNLIR